METEKLFYVTPYETKFTAHVIRSIEGKKGYEVVLDKTMFYPLGGGQPADTGTIGETLVTDVYEKDGEIIHVTDTHVEAGSIVEGHVNWQRRFEFMQNHTGEHVISGIIDSTFGYSNVGFHMGSDFTTLDIDNELTEEQLAFVEKKANEAVYKNIKVKAIYPSPEALEELRYRSKKALSGKIRIVSIKGYDACACCGLHTEFTAEVGIIKILTAQRYKGGMRIYILCGERAFNDYVIKTKNAYAISAMLSAKVNEIPEAVKQVIDENNYHKQKLASYKQQIFQYKANEIAQGSKIAFVFEDGLSANDLRNFSAILAEKVEIAIVFSAENDGYKYAIASSNHDVMELNKKITAQFNGKGGGKKMLAQGTIYGEKQQVVSFLLDL